jgi:hypothetical protein
MVKAPWKRDAKQHFKALDHNQNTALFQTAAVTKHCSFN